MIWEETATTTPLALWPILGSVVGGLLVFIMVRMAIHIYRMGDVTVYAKRLTDLNPRIVKLFLRVENEQTKGRRLKELSLYIHEKKVGMRKVADLEETPLLREGQKEFIEGQGKDACLQCNPRSLNEAVLEFRLTEAYPEVYLVYTNMKGKKRKARIDLNNPSTQILFFRSL